MADEKPKRTRKTTTDATKGAKKTTARKAPARKAATTPRTRRAARPMLTHDQVAARAYELHLEGHGDAFANWVRAEQELATA